MSNDYWINFWKEQGRNSVGKDSQSRVLRTKNKQPINENDWTFFLNYFNEIFHITPNSVVLDLCCGNGLISREFAAQGAQITSVDASADLLAEIENLHLPNINLVCDDMRAVDFPDNQFSHILLYAGIQYISHQEAINLLRACYHWLKPNGILMIGDIPDSGLLWDFYNTDERKKIYFDNLAKGNDIIGTWFSRDWLCYLAESIGFSHIQVQAQPENQINAHFRFDLILGK